MYAYIRKQSLLFRLAHTPNNFSVTTTCGYLQFTCIVKRPLEKRYKKTDGKHYQTKSLSRVRSRDQINSHFYKKKIIWMFS